MPLIRKTGVFGEPRRPISDAIAIIEKIYLYFGQTDLAITSLRDGNHMQGSLHARGYAVDLRTSTVEAGQRPAVAAAIKGALGPAYDVILESDHLHVEFDPEHNGGKNLPDDRPIGGAPAPGPMPGPPARLVS